MIKTVKKREIPKMTWLGGTCCRERARLIKSRTMEIRRKLVMRMMILGARDKTVTRRRSWSEKATSCPDSGLRMVKSIKGITGSAGGVGIAMVPSVERSGKGRVCEKPGAGVRRRARNTRGRAKGTGVFIT
jgi:hypothetical protein